MKECLGLVGGVTVFLVVPCCSPFDVGLTLTDLSLCTSARIIHPLDSSQYFGIARSFVIFVDRFKKLRAQLNGVARDVERVSRLLLKEMVIARE